MTTNVLNKISEKVIWLIDALHMHFFYPKENYARTTVRLLLTMPEFGAEKDVS